MFAFEVYDEYDSLYKVHFVSEPMTTGFIPVALPNMQTGFDLQHFARVRGGFFDKPGDCTPCGLMYDIRIESASAAARDERILPRLTALAGEVDKVAADKGILTFMVFASLDEPNVARILLRLRDRAAFKAYATLPAVADFWLASKEDVSKIQQQAYVENGRGWLHR